MFSMEKNKLHIQGMHMIFNDINVYGKQIGEIEQPDIPKKSQIGVWNRPSCQWNTIFKTTITKNDTFFTYVDVNISKY